MSTRLRAVVNQRSRLYDGFLKIDRYEFDVDKHGGGTMRIKRDVMERGHAVAVLGHDPKRDEVVLGNEFRPGVLVAGEYPFSDNLIAGGIDGSETALEAAVREMREESGLLLGSPILIHSGAYVSSGGTSEKIAIVYGIVDTTLAGGIHGEASEEEDILTVVMPADEFIDRVRSGAINDLKTLIAGYWLAERRSTRRT